MNIQVAVQFLKLISFDMEPRPNSDLMSVAP